MKILITSGATREPIDEVRFISNFSTGSTGAFLADALRERGHDVTLLCGQGSEKPTAVSDVATYSSFEDLDQKLQNLLAQSEFDGIVHLAAVSDYSVGAVESGHQSFQAADLKKLDSSEDVTLKLKKNFKIVSRLKQYAAPSEPVVVAFKLTNSTSLQEQLNYITRLSLDPGVDFVVHNDLHDVKSNKPNRYRVFKNQDVLFESLNKNDLAVKLEQLLGSRL